MESRGNSYANCAGLFCGGGRPEPAPDVAADQSLDSPWGMNAEGWNA